MGRMNGTLTKQLAFETLESRALLAAMPVGGDVGSNPQGSSTLSGGGFPTEVSAVAAAALAFPTPAPGFVATPGTAIVLVGIDTNAQTTFQHASVDATTGVGQMTITTGANTLGVGSFATSTNGFSSENGGRSGG